MKKAGWVFLAALLVLAAGSLKPEAEEFDAYLIKYDPYVYSGGYFDAYAGCGLTNDSEVTYRWCGKYGRDGSFVELDDNERYSGTHTSHFRFLTADGFSYGTDWEELRFACKITYRGKTLYTDDLWMHIGASGTLTADLKRNPITIGSFYKSGGSTSADRFEAKAGERFILSKSISAVEPGLSATLLASEMEPKLFITVTENGKTVFYDNDRGYTPYAAGKGAVSAKAELYLTVNGEKERLLDAKTIVIDTYTGDPAGSGKAKISGSLLKEMYLGAAKVDPDRAVFQKGQWLALLEQKGSWWKVAVNGFVGFVPADALDISAVVEQVSVSIPEPADGASPSFSPVIAEGNCTLFPTEPVTWQKLDVSGAPYMSAGDRFLAGKQYRLVIWLKAKAGYRFPLKNGAPDVKAFVNGRAATVRKAYEQDPEEVLELSVDYTDHVHNLTKIAQVNPTCVRDGKLTYYHCACGADFEDYQGVRRITELTWGILPAAGHFASPWMSNGSEHYKICQRRECMAEIPGTRGTHRGGKATCYAAAVCADCGLEYGSLAAHLPGPAATETSPQVCQYCGTILSPALGHRHSMTAVPEKTATCMDPGNKAYYVCKDCGRLYWDENGDGEIPNASQVETDPLGHEISEDWKYDREYHWRFCVRCNEVLEETKMLHDRNGENGTCATCGFDPSAAFSESPDESEETPAEESIDGSSSGESVGPAENASSEPVPHNYGGDYRGDELIITLLVIVGILFLAAVILLLILIHLNKRRKKKEEQEK